MKKKLKLKKYPNGGENPPIYTTNPNDPRLTGGKYWEHRDPKYDSAAENMAEYIPVYGIPFGINDWMNAGQKFVQTPSWSTAGDLGLETASLIPFGKLLSSVGKGTSKAAKASRAGHFLDFSINALSDESLTPDKKENKKEDKKNTNTPIKPRAGQYIFDANNFANGGGISRYDVPAQIPQNQQYFQLPFNEIATALLSKQKKQDEEIAKGALYADYADKLQSLPQDRLMAQEISNNIRSYVDDLSSGAYDLTSPEGRQRINQARNYIRKEFGPTGRASAIQSNYSTAQNWLKNAQELYKSGKITQEQLNAGYNKFSNEYQGIGDIDPLTGTYNPYNTYDLAEAVDIPKWADSVAKDMEASIRQTAYAKTGNDGYLYEGTDYNEVLTPQEISEAMQNFYMSDRKLQNYLQQGADLGLFDSEELAKGPFAYKQVTSKDKNGKPVSSIQLDYNYNHPLGAAFAGASSKYAKDIFKSTRNIKDDSGYWKKKELEAIPTEDIIDAGTWVNNPFSKDVMNAGESWWSKTFGTNAPKYEQFNKEYNTKKSSLESLKSKRKEGTTDIGLENKISNLESEISQMDNIYKKLDELYDENYKKNKDGKYEFKPYINPNWDEATKAEVQRLADSQRVTANTVDKAKFFDNHIQDLSRSVTQYQRGIKLDNNSTDFEVNVGLTNQRGKRVYGNNGEQLDADITIPTGYITRTSQGIMNLSNAYFTNEDEAEKAGIEVVEMTGDEANADIKLAQSAASAKGNTITAALFPKDTKVYKVKTYTESSTSTKNKYEKMLYNNSEQELSNKLNSNINAGLGGIVKVNDKITIGFNSQSDDSPYLIILNDGKDTQTYRFPDETQAIKFANKAKETLQ